MVQDIEFSDSKEPHTILIVEDQTPDQVLLENQLKTLWPDCRIVPVKSLYEAYNACRKNNFDMVLLDLNLPDGFGPSSVKEIRRVDRNVPIVVITGAMSNITIYEALKNGANNIVSKKQMMENDFLDILKQNS